MVVPVRGAIPQFAINGKFPGVYFVVHDTIKIRISAQNLPSWLAWLELGLVVRALKQFRWGAWLLRFQHAVTFSKSLANGLPTGSADGVFSMVVARRFSANSDVIIGVHFDVEELANRLR